MWSVMVPAYRPDEKYLRLAIESVLQQDRGLEQMQLEVVDDCSPDVDVAGMVKSIAGERVKCSRTDRNLGLAGCWNACIERSRGEWVHILHQDDLALPGFYQRMECGLRMQPSVGAAFCRHAMVECKRPLVEAIRASSRVGGGSEKGQEKIAVEQIILTPAVIVRRSAYEQVGGFSRELCYVLDWEMWQRIAARFPIWFEPSILAAYRIHEGSATSKLIVEAADVRDVQKMIELVPQLSAPNGCGFHPQGANIMPSWPCCRTAN